MIVLGDVHGRSDLLEQMLEQLSDLAHPAARLVCVGDYVDRGDDSAGVLRLLHALQDGAEEGQMVCLLGNHEKMLLDFLDTPEVGGPAWIRHGGLQTLASFRVGLGPEIMADGRSERDWRAVRDDLRGQMGPALEAWLRALPRSWTSGNVFVAHAGADPARAIADQDPRGLLWGGPDFYTRPRKDGIWVAHGHVIVPQPSCENGRISLDTGAYATGRLTAGLIETGSVQFIEARVA